MLVVIEKCEFFIRKTDFIGFIIKLGRQENANQAYNENNERTRWSPETRQGDAGRTHGSLIVSTYTPGMQKLLIQKGIIINGLIYNTRLYNHRLRLERCYCCV